MILSSNDKVRELVSHRRYMEALAICKDWTYEDPADRECLRLGYECVLYPDFYAQLHYNTREAYMDSVAVLERVYGPASTSDTVS